MRDLVRALPLLFALSCGSRSALLEPDEVTGVDANTSFDASTSLDASMDAHDAAPDVPVIVGCYGAGQTTLATGQSSPAAIAIDATNVYWAVSGNDCSSGEIRSMPKAGGAVVTLATHQPSPRAIAVDETRVYFYDGCGSGRLRSVPKGGGGVFDYAVIVDPSEDARVIGVGGDYVYFNAYGVWRVPKTGGAQSEVDDHDFVYALAADDGGVFWVGPVGGGPAYGVFGSLFGGPVNQLAVPDAVGNGIAIDIASVFFVSGEGIARVLRTGGAVVPVSYPASAWKLAVDDDFVYWTDGFTGGNYSIRKAPKTGGPASDLATGPGGYVDLAVDDRCVYWANMYANEIVRAPK